MAYVQKHSSTAGETASEQNPAHLMKDSETGLHLLNSVSSVPSSLSGYGGFNMGSLIARKGGTTYAGSSYNQSSNQDGIWYQLYSSTYNSMKYQTSFGIGIGASPVFATDTTNTSVAMFRAYTGRNRGNVSNTSKAAPTIKYLPTGQSDIKMSDFLGYSHSPITDDMCGMHSLARSRASTPSASVTYQACFPAAPFTGIAGVSSQQFAFVRAGALWWTQDAHSGGTQKHVTAPDTDTVEASISTHNSHMGIMYIYQHLGLIAGDPAGRNNAWQEYYLPTVCAAGDRIVVIRQSSGGTMYTFNTSGAPNSFYVRTEGGSSISGQTFTTHYGPTKNETGTDSWVEVTSMTCSGGEARIGVNPYHSSNQSQHLWAVYIIKGPQAYIQGVSRTKLTGKSDTSTNRQTQFNNSHSGSYNNANHQEGKITTAMSPFVGRNLSHSQSTFPNVIRSGSATHDEEILDFAWTSDTGSSSYNGVWNGSISVNTGPHYAVAQYKGSTFSAVNTGPMWAAHHLSCDYDRIIIEFQRGTGTAGN